MNSEELKKHITDETGKIVHNIEGLEAATKRQLKDTYLASEILLALTKGHEVSAEQITFLKGQSVNLGKALVLIGLQAVPGSSVAIVILEKVAEKHGFSLFPQEQKEPGIPGEKQEENT